jgi:hypothetical protein
VTAEPYVDDSQPAHRPDRWGGGGERLPAFHARPGVVEPPFDDVEKVAQETERRIRAAEARWRWAS